MNMEDQERSLGGRSGALKFNEVKEEEQNWLVVSHFKTKFIFIGAAGSTDIPAPEQQSSHSEQSIVASRPDDPDSSSKAP